MKRAVEIRLKIPDNTAYTALTALRRLSVAVERLERSEIYWFDDDSDEAIFAARIRSDETIFNPNKHLLTLRHDTTPAAGEVWIAGGAPADRGPQAIAWRLLEAGGTPVSDRVLAAAIEGLLCNPAIDRAFTRASGDCTGHFLP